MNAPSANHELVLRVLGAYLSGDEATLRAMIQPETEIHGAPGIVNAGTYWGYDGFRRWIQQWEEAWDEVDYELRELINVGDSIVVAPVQIVGRGAGSGVQIDAVFGWMFEFRDGVAARFHAYATVDDAIEAAERFSTDQVNDRA